MKYLSKVPFFLCFLSFVFLFGLTANSEPLKEYFPDEPLGSRESDSAAGLTSDCGDCGFHFTDNQCGISYNCVKIEQNVTGLLRGQSPRSQGNTDTTQ